MKNITILLSSFLMLLVFAACDLEENQVDSLETFTRIYDNPEFSNSYLPLDVKQTADGGFLMLGANLTEDSDFPGVYLLTADTEGNFVFDQTLAEDFVQPTRNLMPIGNRFYFVCMHRISLIAHLVSVGDSGQASDPIPIVDNDGPILYPLSAALDNSAGQILLQGYDNEDKLTVFAQVSPQGGVVARKSFDIGAGEDVEEPIIEHFTRTGKQLPFLSGQMQDGRFFFNGFYNYTFSLVMTDMNPDSEPSVLQGVQNESGISSTLHLQGNTFALSRFSFGQNYILPQAVVEVGPENPASSEDLLGNAFPELREDAPVILKNLNINGQSVLIYGSDTRSRQIVLLAFDANTGELLGTKYLGFSNPYEMANFSLTQDGGLAVAGQTYVAGRFPRFCLFKLSAEEVQELVN